MEVESVKFNDSISTKETPTLSLEDFRTNSGVKKSFDLKDSTHTFQTMSETSD